MSLEGKIGAIEEAILLMKELLLSHEDRLDEHKESLDEQKETLTEHKKRLDDFYEALDESRKDFEFKLNALIDSQLRNETAISQLNKISQSTLERVERLEKSEN